MIPEKHISTEPQQRNIKKRVISLIIGIFLVVLCVTGYFIYKYETLKKQVDVNSATDQKEAQKEAQQLVSKISKIMLLPSNEIPSIATVTDINKLKNQSFFKQATNGDKVLIYTKSQTVILYNPHMNKIVNMGPLNVNTQAAQPTQAKLDIRNGTTVAGLAARAETELKKAFPNVNIQQKEQASKSDYEKTLIVVLNPTAKEAGETLAKFYNNASVTNLPAGESKPSNIDILVILGKDYTGE